MYIDNLEAIKRLIADSETDRVEFKETTGQLERGMETLCAFLNGTGGTVLFGVGDKGVIVGQEVADSTKRNIAEAINRLEPMAAVQVVYIPLPESERKVVALHVEEARFERPFSYKGRAYMRVESVTTTMPQAVYNSLLMKKTGARRLWESCYNDNLKLSDLDNNEIMRTVRLGIEFGRLPETTTGNDIPTILEKLGVYENGMLKNAAAVLFANRQLHDYPQCLLRLARFRGTDKTVFMDNQRIHGNIFQMLDAAMAFIFKHLSLSGTTDSLIREEHLSVPHKAIREAVINSLCHRSYLVDSGSVGIAIYDDRVEIENPGSFPMEWDMEKIKSSHASKPQNPVIAEVLYIRRAVESWGRGINLMIDECKKVDLPEPEYKTDADEVRIIFKYNIEGKMDIPQAPHKYHTSTVQVTNQVRGLNDSDLIGKKRELTVQPTAQVTPQVPHKYPTSTPQVKIIARLMGGFEYSIKEMMELLQLSDRKHFLNTYLTPGIEAGIVESLYPDNPNHPRQKYRLTEKGKVLFAEMEH